MPQCLPLPLSESPTPTSHPPSSASGEFPGGYGVWISDGPLEGWMVQLRSAGQGAGPIEMGESRADTDPCPLPSHFPGPLFAQGSPTAEQSQLSNHVCQVLGHCSVARSASGAVRNTGRCLAWCLTLPSFLTHGTFQTKCRHPTPASGPGQGNRGPRDKAEPPPSQPTWKRSFRPCQRWSLQFSKTSHARIFSSYIHSLF